jgi:hypothetical protein
MKALIGEDPEAITLMMSIDPRLKELYGAL